MQKVLQVCAYGSEYSGNFIQSLRELENELKKKNIQTIYAFCEKAKNKEWCKEIQNRTEVFFLPEAKARILPRTYQIFRKIYRDKSIIAVHSHFELYDIPSTLMAPRNMKIFWHLHDPINTQDGLRSILWKLQYGYVSKRAFLISVSDFYRRKVIKLGVNEQNTCVLLNGIDLNRVSLDLVNENKEFDFLTFGWDFYRKGDDLIIQACKKLCQEGYKFNLLINGNENTWDVLDEYLHGENLPFLTKGNPTKNVADLFAKSKVFIQASRKETFSYAVCEAAYAGLPIISSDISGLEWAHDLSTVSFFPSEDVDMLYAIMKNYLDGVTFTDDEIENTKNIIREKYSIKAWCEKMLDIYNF